MAKTIRNRAAYVVRYAIGRLALKTGLFVALCLAGAGALVIMLGAMGISYTTPVLFISAPAAIFIIIMAWQLTRRWTRYL